MYYPEDNLFFMSGLDRVKQTWMCFHDNTPNEYTLCGTKKNFKAPEDKGMI